MRLVQAATFAFTVLVLMCVPWLAPRYTLFGVRTGASFRSTEPARQAVAFFLRSLAATLALGLSLLWLTPPTVGIFISLLLPVGVFVWTFIHLNRKLKPFAEQRPATGQLDLSEVEEMPRTKWMSICPVAMLACTAFYLQQNWSRIPQRFPVHWGLNGQPNGWANRTFAGVYGILILMAALVLWLILLNAVLWFRTRNSQSRRAIFNLTILVEFSIAICPSYIALSPLWGWPSWIVLVLAVAPVAGILLYASNQGGKPSDPDSDITPESAWLGGLLYFNRQDPVLAVPRGDGFGYVFNFAHATSWLLLLAPFAIVLAWRVLL